MTHTKDSFQNGTEADKNAMDVTAAYRNGAIASVNEIQCYSSNKIQVVKSLYRANEVFPASSDFSAIRLN